MSLSLDIIVIFHGIHDHGQMAFKIKCLNLLVSKHVLTWKFIVTKETACFSHIIIYTTKIAHQICNLNI